MNTQNPQTKLSFDQMPEAITFLVNEMVELKKIVQQNGISAPIKRQPIGIYQASKIIGKAIQTIYGLVSAKKIPYYKQGKQLYFYEDELLAYIESGKNGGRNEFEH
jgi:excisionase family DNA binding protein